MWTNRLLTPRFTVACRVASANAFDVLTNGTSLHADWILLPQENYAKITFSRATFFAAKSIINPTSLSPAEALPFINSNVTTLSHENFLFGTYFGVSLSLSPRRATVLGPITKTGANHSPPNCPSGGIISTFR